MCEAAARLAASLRPALITMMGFVERFARRRKEGARVAYRLHVDDDGVRLEIVPQIVDGSPQPTSSIDPAR